MKKLILMLALFIPISVFASVHYTGYEFKERTNKFYDESDILRRKEVKLYENIKRIVSKDYLEKDDCKNKIDQDDYKVKKFYSNHYLDGYDSIANLKASNYKKVRYIFIYDYDIEPLIKDIEVYSNGKPIDKIYMSGVFDSFTGMSPYLIFDLGRLYEFESLSLNIIFDNVVLDDDLSFSLYFSDDKYVVPLENVFNTRIWLNLGVSNQLVHIIDDAMYDNILNSLDFPVRARNAINYFYKDIYYYACMNEEYVRSGNFTEEANEGYELDYDNYKVVYDYYERKKYETLDVIKSDDDFFNLVTSGVYVTKSNIDINKNGIYDYWVGKDKYSIKVDIENNNKIIKSEPSIKEKIVYKVLNNNASKSNNAKIANKTEKVSKTVCKESAKCHGCNYKIYKIIIILLSLLVIYLAVKNRYILTKGYKL